MIIECHICEAIVNAEVVAQHTARDEDDPAPFETSLLVCPQCGTTLVGGRYEFEEAGEPLSRLWPAPSRWLSHDIPEITRKSLEEARLCLKAHAYNACTVMAGRALEGVCRHFGAEKTNLGPGIKSLRDQGIIDARLAQWAAELQKARNLSAHASGEKVTKADATDLMDFVEAICEYVFVLSEKFEQYMTRRAKASGTNVAPAPVSDLDSEDVAG